MILLSPEKYQVVPRLRTTKDHKRLQQNNKTKAIRVQLKFKKQAYPQQQIPCIRTSKTAQNKILLATAL